MWFQSADYLPVIVPLSLISIFTELFVISSMRLSVTLDLIVRLYRGADLDDFLDMSLESRRCRINVVHRMMLDVEDTTGPCRTTTAPSDDDKLIEWESVRGL